MLTHSYRIGITPVSFVNAGDSAPQGTMSPSDPRLFQNWLAPEKYVARQALFSGNGVVQLEDGLYATLEADTSFSPEQVFITLPNGWYISGFTQF